MSHILSQCRATDDGALQTAIELLEFEVVVLLIPGVTYGSMDVGDVQLIGAGNDAFGDRPTTRYHQIVIRHVYLLDCQWHQRKVAAEVLTGAG